MTGNQTRQSFLNQKISIVMHLHKLMRRENLRTVILLATCAGMLLPALVGGLILNHVDQGRVNQELNRSLQDKIVLLADRGVSEFLCVRRIETFRNGVRRV